MHKKLVLFVIVCQRINYNYDSASAISVSILFRILFMIGLPVMIVPGIESDDDFSISSDRAPPTLKKLADFNKSGY